MNPNVRKKWMVVGGLWAAVMLLSVWNVQTMTGIAEGRRAWEDAEQNRAFLAAQQQRREEVAGQLARLSRPVDSLVFGRLAVKEDLERLAASFALLDFKVSEAELPVSGMNVPITVTFRGALVTANRWLVAVQTELPFLSVRGLKAQAGNPGEGATYTVELTGRFREASS